MTREEVQQALQILHRAYPSYQIPDKKQAVELWAAYLKDYDSRTVVTAVKLHIGSNKFFPSISEIVGAANKLQGVNNTPRIEAPERVIDWKESGCQLCPYLRQNQSEPCEVCVW